MSDPKRLVEYHDDADVLGALRCGAEVGPPAGAKRQVWAALIAGSAAAAAVSTTAEAASGATSGATAAATTPGAAGSAGAAGAAGVGKTGTLAWATIAKWLAVTSVAGAVAVAGHQFLLEDRGPVERARLQQASDDAKATAPVVEDQALALAELSPTTDTSKPAPSAIPSKLERSKAAPTTRVQPPVKNSRANKTANAAHATSEATLVLKARRALRKGNPERALKLLRAAPAVGLLTQEREALEIEALIQIGETELARRRAAKFSKRYPVSPHAARLNGLLK